MKSNKFYLDIAYEQAIKSKNENYPNPAVGAVIVKDGKIISTGYHHRYGDVHAEVDAINNAMDDISGSTIYVTLEPCSTVGKTPACSWEIVKNKIAKVVVGAIDPTKENGSKAKEIFEQNNIEYIIERHEPSMRLAEQFKEIYNNQFPYVVLKSAVTLDGKIATSTGSSKWITGLISRDYSRNLRDSFDAIIVGVNTVNFDNPKLTGIKRNPEVYILDPNNRIGTDLQVLERKNVHVINGKINLSLFLQELKQKKLNRILIEGGSHTVSEFIKQGLFNEVHYYISPKILGDKDALNAFNFQKPEFISDAVNLKIQEVKQLGEDILIRLEK